MIVVKLGGSLAGGPSLKPWLDAMSDLATPCVVVAGGGVFADTVRDAQGKFGFSDNAAHAMALLAMEQYAFMLADLAPALVPAPTLDAIVTISQSGRVPVWLPVGMVLGEAEIAASWEVTSDSLAAWLAGRLGARHLVLVKSAEASDGSSPTDWVASGLVDPAFPDYAERYLKPAHCQPHCLHASLSHLLAGFA
jgi:dihydroneopterin aldolase